MRQENQVEEVKEEKQEETPKVEVSSKTPEINSEFKEADDVVIEDLNKKRKSRAKVIQLFSKISKSIKDSTQREGGILKFMGNKKEQAKQESNTKASESSKQNSTESTKEEEFTLSDKFKNLDIKIQNRLNNGEGIDDLTDEINNFAISLKYAKDSEEKSKIEKQFMNLQKEISEFYKANQDVKKKEQEKRVYESLKKSGVLGEEVNNKKLKDEIFPGQSSFGKDFKAKDDRGMYEKWKDERKLKKDRKAANALYGAEVKKLNDKYFNKLLGEANLSELRKLPVADRKIREEKMINDIVAKTSDPYKRQDILNRYKLRKDAEKKLSNMRSEVDDKISLNKDRKRFSKKVEKEINEVRKEMAEIKDRKFSVPGDMEAYDNLKKKLKELNSLSREKENKLKVFTREQLKNRKARLESLELKDKLNKLEQSFKNDLKKAGKRILSAGSTLIASPFKAIGEAFSAGGFYEGISEFTGRILADIGSIGKDTLFALKDLSLAIGKGGFIGARYAIAH
jgi:hypothetical protein